MNTETTGTAVKDPFDLSRLCRFFSERSPQPMVAVEGQTHIIRYVNPAFARLSEKASEELIGRPFAEAIPEPAGNGCAVLLDRVFQTGMPEKLPDQEHQHSPRAYWSYAMWAILGADEQPIGVMIQVTEVTEAADFRRQATAMNEALVVSAVRQHELIETIQQGEKERHQLQIQLFQAQKLESLGVLAGGLAHDLNNMLTPVVGFAELAARSLPHDSPAISMLAEVRRNACRATELVQQILAYAGKGRLHIQPVDLSTLVRDMSGLLNSAVSINTEFRHELAPNLPLVEADAAQLRQVVVNLITNASEAIATAAGVITIRTGSSPDELRSGPSVFLEVTDTGSGMTPEVIEKIFDPFFTTKFTGRGLGLAVVQGIARGHNGELRVSSEVGKGTTFRLFLPRAKTVASTPIALPPLKDSRGSGSILVIDDDSGIRKVAAMILQFAGFTVVVAEDGVEGLQVFQEREQKFDAVLLDMTMPRMSGLETARALRGHRTDLPIILMSGFSVEEVTTQTEGLGIAGFVQKPFKTKDLLAAVRLALNQ